MSLQNVMTVQPIFYYILTNAVIQATKNTALQDLLNLVHYIFNDSITLFWPLAA